MAFRDNERCKALGYESHCSSEAPGSGAGGGPCLVGTWDTDPSSTCGQEQNLPDQTVSVAFTCSDTIAVVDGVSWHRR